MLTLYGFISAFTGATIMISICCTLPKPDYNVLLPEQKKRFGFLVHQLRKKGYTLFSASCCWMRSMGSASGKSDHHNGILSLPTYPQNKPQYMMAMPIYCGLSPYSEAKLDVSNLPDVHKYQAIYLLFKH